MVFLNLFERCKKETLKNVNPVFRKLLEDLFRRPMSGDAAQMVQMCLKLTDLAERLYGGHANIVLMLDPMSSEAAWCTSHADYMIQRSYKVGKRLQKVHPDDRRLVGAYNPFKHLGNPELADFLLDQAEKVNKKRKNPDVIGSIAYDKDVDGLAKRRCPSDQQKRLCGQFEGNVDPDSMRCDGDHLQFQVNSHLYPEVYLQFKLPVDLIRPVLDPVIRLADQ